MKIRHLFITLIALATVHAEPIGINAVAGKPADYAGKAITVTGYVDRVSASKRMVVLIDATEATCTDGCDRKTLVVEIPAEAPLPAKGTSLTVTGTLVDEGKPLRLVAKDAGPGE